MARLNRTEMFMSQKRHLFLLVPLCIALLLAGKGLSQEASSSAAGKPTLAHASLCASLKEGSPHNSGIVFPVSQGRVLCFTSFDPVPQKTFIFHSWFHRDNLITRQKLTLNPPRWSTYSTIQLRESDKGPWRVEISDQEENRLGVLRFSITD